MATRARELDKIDRKILRILQQENEAANLTGDIASEEVGDELSAG